jgi:hypothetical protein
MVRGRPKIYLAADASGAVAAARRRQVVLIVDVIDMSTTLESALEAGAVAVYGASPLPHRAPVPVCPGAIGYAAGREARARGTGVVVVAEPRLGSHAERLRRSGAVLAGVRAGGGRVMAVLPNVGKEIPRLFPLGGQVVVAVTASGGVAYDAAFNAAGRVLTGTVARTYQSKGSGPARRAAERALSLACAEGRDICVVAASRNSLEDLLGAAYIFRLLGGACRG